MPATRLHGWTGALVVLAAASCGNGAPSLVRGGPRGDAGGSADGGAVDAGCQSSVAPAPGLVSTDRGLVKGTQQDETWAYLGVPYAAPPVGPLRWAAPEAHACWSTPLEASAFGAACSQPGPAGTVTGQEDCLTVNVWAPATATATSQLPVLFFIHGGYNVTGSSASYNDFCDRQPASCPSPSHGTYMLAGANLAAKTRSVVVSLNYRLGAMGFLAHPAFGAHPGNYGTLDQIFALAWVHTNIAAFGGDPARVLVFGQSAGATNTCAIVASPLAKGLLSAALMESGLCEAQTTASAQAFASTFATKVACDTASNVAQCLRALDASTVTGAFPPPDLTKLFLTGKSGTPANYEPSVDGYVLLDTPRKVIASGAHNHVPVVIGSNADEASGLVDLFPNGMTEAQRETGALVLSGNDQVRASQGLAAYPLSDYGGDPLKATIATASDMAFTCQARHDARNFAKGQSEPVWRYFFTELDPVTPYAWHGLELYYVFRNWSYAPPAQDDSLGDAVQGYWSRLASTGDPNGTGAIAWPSYDPPSDPYLQLGTPIHASTGLHSKQCDFWDSVLTY